MRKVGTIGCWTVAIMIAAAVWAISGRLPLFAKWLDVGEPYKRVNAVMALPGDAERRPFVAAALVNVGLADKVIIVSSAPNTDVVDEVREPEHAVTKAIYTARGIPPEKILVIEGRSSSTIHDTRQLTAYLIRNPGHTVGVITNAYHTRRARWTIHRRAPEIADQIAIFSAPNPSHLDGAWWRTPKGMQTVLSEYLKLAAYNVRLRPRGTDAVVLIVVLLFMVRYGRRFLPFTGRTRRVECTSTGG